ncbi:TRDMT1 [Branchiostoma lanceolatum]|uniref:TRDMT1 protein n=1 Tax=Branchiostoma lanceolatum TaxID=7740 RepID=A0A8J9Z1J6_BRALA|nr:TRDMT1 [Branchiostoma lanceolatum]
MHSENDQARPLRVVEFYSGVGGMHYAILESKLPATVVAALDINTTANAVYRHNFPHVSLLQRDITGIKLPEFQSWKADVFMMSPPCQPFTRVGLKGDTADPRTKSFLYILDILRRMSDPPSHILLENVKGFETSETRSNLVVTLEDCGYSYQEFLLSPNQFGIPNSRLRYFLLAKRKPLTFAFEQQTDIMKEMPSNSLIGSTAPANQGVSSSAVANQSSNQSSQSIPCPYSIFDPEDRDTTNCREISEFLTPHSKEEEKCLLLQDKLLDRYWKVLDIVTPRSRRSCCFTKAYGHYVEGTGSVLFSQIDVDAKEIFTKVSESEDQTERLDLLHQLKMRFFSPREVASLHCLPPEFTFPEVTTTKQRYRVLGNSLNAHVVGELFKLLVR